MPQQTEAGDIIEFLRIPLRMAMAIVAACSVIIAAPGAHAQDAYPNVWLNPGFLTYHFDRDADLREDNWGFGAEVELKANHALIAGTFINSEDERSNYFGYAWRPLHWDVGGTDVSLGVVAAGLDGYPRNEDGDWFPVLLPSAGSAGRATRRQSHGHSDHRGSRLRRGRSAIQAQDLVDRIGCCRSPWSYERPVHAGSSMTGCLRVLCGRLSQVPSKMSSSCSFEPDRET